jgi:cleavage stimulation factor subunit 3
METLIESGVSVVPKETNPELITEGQSNADTSSTAGAGSSTAPLEAVVPSTTVSRVEDSAAQAPLKLKNLPPRLEKLQQIVTDDVYLFEGWITLLNEFMSSSSTKERHDDIRTLYDRFLLYFPYATKYWIAYIDFEVRMKDHSRISTLFSKCLRLIHSFDIFKAYLNYIRRTHSISEDANQGRAVIKQAYDFVLAKVAHDRESGPIWSDYLSFLKAVQVNSAFEEQQKVDEIRKVYQRAVSLPINNVEQIWREWDTWENGVNKVTAKKMLSERSSSYLNARTVLRTLKGFYENLDRCQPIMSSPTFTVAEKSLLASWRKVIQWERGNPLKIEDNSTLYERISWVFWQALNVLPRFPELWYDFAMYSSSAGKQEKVLSILKSGCDSCRGRCVNSCL